MLLVLTLLTIIPAVSANTGAVHLTSAYQYKNTVYNTYLSWTPDVFADRVNYALGSDSHINFTQASTTSSANPSWNFGVATMNGNATLQIIAANYIRFATTVLPSRTMNFTFYYAYPGPKQVDLTVASVNSTIVAASYKVTLAAFEAAPSPAVFNDSANGRYMVKYTTEPTTIQFDLTASTPLYTVSFASSPGGGGTTVPSSPVVVANTTVVGISATPAPGYTFSGWTSTSAHIEITSPGSATTTITVHATGTVTAIFTSSGPPAGKPYVDIVTILSFLVTMLVLDFGGYKLKRGGGLLWIGSMTLGMYLIGMIFESAGIIMNADVSPITGSYVYNTADPNVLAVLVVVATAISAYLIYWDYFYSE